MKLRKRRRRTLKGGSPVSPAQPAQPAQNPKSEPVNTTQIDEQIKQTETALNELKSKRNSMKGKSACSIM